VTAPVEIREARLPEIDELSALCYRSKAHWGYDAVFMARCVPHLRVSLEAIGKDFAFVATAGDRPVGVHQISVNGTGADLDLLFVDPPAIGTGVGRRLYRHAAGVALAAGCRKISIVADPFATAFYAAMGAQYVEDVPSDAIPGRMLPRYVHRLSSRR
jgi:GNAT superfamily N-acetyltransferase